MSDIRSKFARDYELGRIRQDADYSLGAPQFVGFTVALNNGRRHMGTVTAIDGDQIFLTEEVGGAQITVDVADIASSGTYNR